MDRNQHHTALIIETVM
ncbi:hypothetical protein CapIbe_024261, partial [Capra ibex]